MEGTAAHFIGEQCLRYGFNADTFLGQWIVVDENNERPVKAVPDLGSVESGYRVFSADMEMVSAVQVYVDYCRTHMAGDCAVEEHVRVNDDVYGTPDFRCAVPFGPLYVDDYKHGAGVLVSPENNPQAMIYALAALMASPYDHTAIHISIIQPRARCEEQVKTWTTVPADLYQWAETVLYPAVAACKEENAPLHAGEHCRFCRAAGDCAEKVRHAREVSGARGFGAQMELPRPDQLSVLEQVTALEELRQIAIWRDQLEEYMVENAYRSAAQYPGMKLARGNSIRRWEDPTAVHIHFQGILGDALFKAPQLDTPAGVERCLVDLGWKKSVAAEEVAKFAIKPEGKLRLVPEDAKGEEVKPAGVGVFDPLPEQ